MLRGVKLTLAVVAAAVFGAAGAEVCPVAGDEKLSAALRELRQKYDVPAIAGAFVTSKGLERCAVAGVRKRGTAVAVTTNDLWHLGSDTKAMTATLAAVLVEAGRLKWEATVAEIFPELATSLHPATTNITLKHLLAHRAGLPRDVSWGKFKQTDVREQRLQLVRELFAKPPETLPGENFHYSNAGYAVIGAMLERVTGQTWEDAMRERVFRPLGMTSVGYGGLGTPGQLDQPWPHGQKGKPQRENGPAVDNPPVISPAGRVHCTLQDWGKFIADVLRGVRGEPALLKKSTYEMLLTPPFGGDYALGWGLAYRNWGGGMVLNHCGCNGLYFANAWVAPLKDFAVLVCLNQGDDVAFKASDAAAGALLRLRR
jgi:CubicO group peptidase (beta-lactamase class C family)